MWVVGIDGCAPMNMTMVKNDTKNKERERFSGNFSNHIIHDQKTFLHDLVVRPSKDLSRKTGSSYLVAAEKQPNCFFCFDTKSTMEPKHFKV